MHNFKFKYKGGEDEPWEAQGRGKHVVGALDNLIDNMKLRGCDIDDDDFKIEFLEQALEAVANPNEVSERRDFSTPESNYDLTYTKSE